MSIDSIFSIESSFGWEEDTTLQTFQNYILDLKEEELISRDIDMLEQKINETRTKIRRLRGDSVTILTTEMSDLEIDCDQGNVKDSLSFLEIEQEVCRLEDESHELERKRREAVSRLENKMLGNILGIEKKELLPLIPTPMPEGLSASMLFESRATLTSFDVPNIESSQISRLPTSSETEISEVGESSTQKEEL